jgi:hypothetical protein
LSHPSQPKALRSVGLSHCSLAKRRIAPHLACSQARYTPHWAAMSCSQATGGSRSPHMSHSPAREGHRSTAMSDPKATKLHCWTDKSLPARHVSHLWGYETFLSADNVTSPTRGPRRVAANTPRWLGDGLRPRANTPPPRDPSRCRRANTTRRRCGRHLSRGNVTMPASDRVSPTSEVTGARSEVTGARSEAARVGLGQSSDAADTAYLFPHARFTAARASWETLASLPRTVTVNCPNRSTVYQTCASYRSG